jgi:hypothetical protein
MMTGFRQGRAASERGNSVIEVVGSNRRGDPLGILLTMLVLDRRRWAASCGAQGRRRWVCRRQESPLGWFLVLRLITGPDGIFDGR